MRQPNLAFLCAIITLIMPQEGLLSDHHPEVFEERKNSNEIKTNSRKNI